MQHTTSWLLEFKTHTNTLSMAANSKFASAVDELVWLQTGLMLFVGFGLVVAEAIEEIGSLRGEKGDAWSYRGIHRKYTPTSAARDRSAKQEEALKALLKHMHAARERLNKNNLRLETTHREGDSAAITELKDEFELLKTDLSDRISWLEEPTVYDSHDCPCPKDLYHVAEVIREVYKGAEKCFPAHTTTLDAISKLAKERFSDDAVSQIQCENLNRRRRARAASLLFYYPLNRWL